jgi:hypothetical protein
MKVRHLMIYIFNLYFSGTQILYLGSRGEVSIKYYELTADKPYCHFIVNFGEGSPMRGLGVLFVYCFYFPLIRCYLKYMLIQVKMKLLVSIGKNFIKNICFFLIEYLIFFFFFTTVLPICRLTAKDTVEPISFVVPRRSELFQDDLYPPVIDSSTPSRTASECMMVNLF